MSSYTSTLTYLYGLQRRGMKFGLRNVRSLLRSVGNPEAKFPSIHVAGTNGKGSTAAFLASIMMEAGHRTGLYTSPHLVNFTERIRINGREIPEKRLVDYAARIRPAVERVHATFFEATTCIAFMYFADEGIDVAIVETGLGGRLDSTNVLAPLASVITNVGLDHTDILGKTIRAIAREKAGIMKEHTPCVTSATDPVTLAVFRATARRRHSILHRAKGKVRCTLERFEPPVISLRSRTFSIRGVRPGLTGIHQILNARLAVATMDVLKNVSRSHPLLKQIGNATVKKGLENVVRNTHLRGRFERVGRPAQYILDVAHNPDGMRSLVWTLRSRGWHNLPVVFGVMKDKDYSTMAGELASISRNIIAVAPSIKRALGARALFSQLGTLRIPASYGGTVKQGILAAKRSSRKDLPVLITGSHYVVGEAMQALGCESA